ncbi:MAG: DinB family protein [Anaerolineales bacterium]
MNISYAITELKRSTAVIRSLVEDIDPATMRWKPADTSWSMLEVLCHLRDEERQDFPFRIRHLLSGAQHPWPPIQPAQWVTERRYNEEEPSEALQAFLEERHKNLEWLGTLDSVSWDIAYAYEPLRGLTAGDLLAAWVVHDLLHIRQINELRYFIARERLSEYKIIYAGDW